MRIMRRMDSEIHERAYRLARTTKASGARKEAREMARGRND